MDFFIYNTDAPSLTEPPLPRFPVLIARQFAALGGDRTKYGKQFEQLAKDDMLLMYENSRGIVAVGSVMTEWDGESHVDPWYYNRKEMGHLSGAALEYRIPVRWFADLSNKPISLQSFRKHIGSPHFTPRGAIRRIAKHRNAVTQMVATLLSQTKATQHAIDLSPPSRVEATTYRILRDTAMSVYVKELYQHRCQICGYSIVLPNGNGYAEAHHIKPLGKPHNGPDIMPNVICVCPNHHAQLDFGALTLALHSLTLHPGHLIHSGFVDYHNSVVCGVSTGG